MNRPFLPESLSQLSAPKLALVLITTLVSFYLFNRSMSRRSSGLEWRNTTVAGVTVDAPCELTSVKTDLPPAVSFLIESSESYEGRWGREKFQLGVVRMTWKAGFPVDLDAAVTGGINGNAARFGDKQPRYTMNTLSVAGLDARRAHYEATYQGRPVGIDYLAVQRGQVVWMIVSASNGEHSAVVDRIFGSVQIK
jgi:hypothetical protein